MRTALSMLLGVAILFALTLSVRAEKEAKEVEVTGTITCAKCDLKLIKGKAKGSDKEEVFYLKFKDEDAGKENHKKICTEAKKGSVTGAVSEKDGQKWISVKEIKFD